MTLRKKGQVTLPENIQKAAHLEEGDLLDVQLTNDGILLRPHKLIDASESWSGPQIGRRKNTKQTPI